MKIYCAGIGGIGLSAYAALAQAVGHTVEGSDPSDSAVTRDLVDRGIAVHREQDGSHVPADAGLFVFSEALAPEHPERAAAQRLGIRSVSYFQALGELSKPAFVIAVCGTHGKSSTTAMCARMLIDAGKDPTVVVGTRVPELQGTNWRLGKSDIFLVEACEYRRSFHYLSPDIVLMTSVDGDHFDAYADVDEYRSAFVDFLKMLPADGVVVTHGADAACAGVVAAAQRTMRDADVFADPVLLVPGAHMRQNAKLVLGLAAALDISEQAARDALAQFSGTWRRMEVKGVRPDNVVVVDDYAHHPAEIRATLAAMREAYPERRIVCAFQPHTHDRTIKLYDDFLTAFTDANVVIIPNVYDARAFRDSGVVDVPQFVRDIANRSFCETVHGESLARTEALLRDGFLQAGDVLVCMGAGDITRLAAAMIIA